MKTIVILISFIIVNFDVCFTQDVFNPEKHKYIYTDRDDDRHLSTRGFVQYKMRNNIPSLAFDNNFNRDQLTDWKFKVRKKLHELMNFPVSVNQPKPKLLNKIDRDSYSVEKWEAYPQEGSVITFLMLVPHGVSSSNPSPAVICYPGSNRTKENLAGELELNVKFKVDRHYEKNEMAKYYAENGIISIALDNPGVGELSDLESFTIAPNYDRSTFSRFLIDMGWHYLGLSAYNGQVIINWMKNLDFIDSDRIALSGHSLGTEPVMVLGVLNPEIRAIVFNDFLTNTVRRSLAETKPNDKGIRQSANWLGHSVPGLWNWFDFSDLLASLSPMHLLITEGGVTIDLQTVKNSYILSNAEYNFQVYFYDKYANSENRLDYDIIPEGLSQEEFFQYANVDAPNHYFKSKKAVPWLVNVMK